MRKLFMTACLIITTLFSAMNGAYAGSVTAENIFSSLGGTTTIDQGGAIHSQTRSIYSLGGGMTTFKGKRVSLLAADPPSFSAGCAGISWHFGGFSFISVDEIRQMVEAIAQASLGVAVDLAMQTLCPQCYAVMSKLRDIANMMRNAAADSCKVAKHFGAMLQEKGVFSSDKRITDCSQVSADAGKVDSFMGALTSPCSLINKAETELTTIGNDVLNFLGAGNNGVAKTPPKDIVDASGNMTYEALDALGYKDGFVKNVLLSYTGMAIIDPVPGKDCKESFKNLFGSSAADAKASSEVLKLIGDEPPTTVITTTNTNPTPSDAKDSAAKTEAGQATKSSVVCYAPPLLTGVQEMAMKMICGYYPQADMATFSTRFNLSPEKLAASSLGAMCRVNKLADMASAGPNRALSMSTKDQDDPWIYSCSAEATSRCVRPQLVRMSNAVYGASPTGDYTGLAWMIMDALYSGVRAVATDKPLPATTVAILNGSGYPLYRLINMAAVYPGMADELLQAYGAIIATHYALDTIEKISKPGILPTISLKAGKGGLPRQEVTQIREHIMNILNEAGPMRDQVLKRLSEKRALVDTIVEVNRALQAEVISQGLGGNADLAVSIKRQAAAQASTSPTTP